MIPKKINEILQHTKLLYVFILILASGVAVYAFSGFSENHNQPEKYISEHNESLVLYHADNTFIIDEIINNNIHSFKGKYTIEDNNLVLEYFAFGYVRKFDIVEKGKLLKDGETKWKRTYT